MAQKIEETTTVSEMFEQLEDMKKDMIEKRDFEMSNQLDIAKTLIKLVLSHSKIKKLMPLN